MRGVTSTLHHLTNDRWSEGDEEEEEGRAGGRPASFFFFFYLRAAREKERWPELGGRPIRARSQRGASGATGS